METYQNAGLGKDTELGLIGEQRGVLNANRKRWADIERATVAYVMVLLQHHYKLHELMRL